MLDFGVEFFAHALEFEKFLDLGFEGGVAHKVDPPLSFLFDYPCNHIIIY